MNSPLHLGEATNAARQICHSYALLQGSDHSYGTGIKTTCIRQAEFDSGEWQTVSRGLGIYLHSISLIYSNILCMIWNGNVLMQKKLIRKIIEKWHLIFVITNATRSNNFVLSMKTWIERTNECFHCKGRHCLLSVTILHKQPFPYLDIQQ